MITLNDRKVDLIAELIRANDRKVDLIAKLISANDQCSRSDRKADQRK